MSRRCFNIFGRGTVHSGDAKGVAVANIQIAEFGTAELYRVRQNGLEHWAKLARRAGDDAQHLRGRGLLRQRLIAFARPLSSCSLKFAAEDTRPRPAVAFFRRLGLAVFLPRCSANAINAIDATSGPRLMRPS